MYTPSSTYRIQLSSSFKLQNVADIIQYLDELGISTIYASPFFPAVKGSTHGYDVTFPGGINPEIGNIEEFRAISKRLRQSAMGWLQDIVPNHMAWSAQNLWLADVLERGQNSPFYSFFDIDWSHPGCGGKLMAPFLGSGLEDALKNNELSVQYDHRSFFITYFDQQFPLCVASWMHLLKQLRHQHSINFFIELLSQPQGSYKDWVDTKEKLWAVVSASAELRSELNRVLHQLNNDTGAKRELLQQQYYELMPWQAAASKINYRRFFTINSLIGLRAEQEEVFDHYHQFIRTLCAERLIHGLRIDHVDGLYSPADYIRRLRKLVGADVYIVVEKILEPEERMPASWSIQGSTGYDFLAALNRLFTFPGGADKLNALYEDFSKASLNFEDLVFDKKLECINGQMAGDLENLVRYMKQLHVLPASADPDKYRRALAVIMAAFPVYRLYIDSDRVLESEQQELLKNALILARRKQDDIGNELIYFASLFLQTSPDSNALLLLKRIQQFSGVLMAKGVEDTAFYIYNKLISRNEVGDHPSKESLTAASFHRLMLERQQSGLLSMNATATHDTKRGEDARMRIAVLSELPDEWSGCVQQLGAAMADYKIKGIEGVPFPDPNTEYFIYQSMLGAWPFEETTGEDFKKRFNEFIIKAVREAKTYTNWTEPNRQYEDATRSFCEHFLQHNELLSAVFLPLVKKTMHFGALYSLEQVALKATAPGIPDIYQGTELWDLSFVDPDNRREVDFEARKKYLSQFKKAMQRDLNDVTQELKTPEGISSGKIKMYVLNRILQTRRKLKGLFEEGYYIPLSVEGELHNHILAFARMRESEWAITAVPLYLTEVIRQGEFPEGKKVWKDTSILLPENAPDKWKNIFTGQLSFADAGKIPAADVFKNFPVAVLTAKNYA